MGSCGAALLWAHAAGTLSTQKEGAQSSLPDAALLETFLREEMQPECVPPSVLQDKSPPPFLGATEPFRAATDVGGAAAGSVAEGVPPCEAARTRVIGV